jgi:feruloyl esterase
MNGGGGWDGSLRLPNAPDATGYATSGANGGYMANNWVTTPAAPSEPQTGCGSFGLKEPYFSLYYNKAEYPTGAGGWYGDTDPKGSGNPTAEQKVVDYGIRHLYETPVIAKKIIEQYYHKAPVRSYYIGGSNGGKEGQISAQQFPELYDGFFIGWPLGGHVAVTFRGMWDTLWGAELAKSLGGRDTVYSKYKAALHYKTVYDKCDPVDGLVDGMIDDPTKCKFDAMTDLPACSDAEEAAEGVGGIYSSTCFTLAQRQALKEIYAGPHNSRGKAWYPGTPVGAEYVTKSGSIGFSAAILDDRAPCMFMNIAMDPPQGPDFDITKFDWDKDPVRMQKTTVDGCVADTCKTYTVHDTSDAITISPEPKFNMGGYKAVYKKGAKIVQFHGWSDALVSALAASRGLYETTLQNMGVEKTKSFWKLYLVPGAGHGGGGLSAWTTNTTGFNAMVDWVENGEEPGAFLGSRNANVDANYPAARTRPNCPYPEVARYSGDGSIDDAANFMCVPPIDVNIVPEVLNLKNKGLFTAVITVPEGYKLNDWNIGNLSCEGVPMVSGVLSGNSYTAKFNRQDLVGVSGGDAVSITVKGTFTHGGKVAQIQASDTVKVIK